MVIQAPILLGLIDSMSDPTHRHHSRYHLHRSVSSAWAEGILGIVKVFKTTKVAEGNNGIIKQKTKKSNYDRNKVLLILNLTNLY